jgi:hypothetical protein
MASRQNSSQMLNSQSSSSNSTTSSNASKDKTSHGGKSDAKNKHGKVIHKFTSESYLRIICEKSPPTSSTSNNDKKLSLLDKSSSTSSGHVPMSSNTIINSMNNMSKRKGTSFQITSVSVTPQQQQQQQQRADNNGDDSADDLDESHTDDNISRITDYETPSFSEDTFSREDVFFAQPNAFGTAPVIPTSSQYGLAIVGPDLGGNGSSLSDVHVSVSDAGINIMGQNPNKQDADHKNERFKVVKIESTEPFKRGRWMCMDYLDHTTLQAQDDGIDGSQKDEGGENVVKTKDSGLESGLEGNEDNGDMEHMNDNDGFDQEVLRAEMMNHQGGDIVMNHQASHGHHTMTSITIHHHNEYPLQMHAQSMPQGQLEQLIAHQESGRVESKVDQETLPASHNTNNPGGNQNPSADNSSSMTHQQQQQQQQQHNHHHAQSMTPEMIQRSLENQQFNQGATLPTNILMQNLGLDQHHRQQSLNNASNMQQQSIASPIPVPNENMGENNENKPPPDSVTSQFQPNQQVGTGDNKYQQSSNNESEQHQQSGSASTNDNLISNSSVSDNNNNNNDGTQNTSSPSSSAGLGTATEGGASEANSNNASATAAAAAPDDGQSMNEDSER